MNKEQLDQWSEQADTYADEVLQTPGEYHPNWHEVRDAYFATLVRNAALEEAALMCVSFDPHPDQWSPQAEYTERRMVNTCAQAIRTMKEPTT